MDRWKTEPARPAKEIPAAQPVTVTEAQVKMLQKEFPGITAEVAAEFNSAALQVDFDKRYDFQNPDPSITFDKQQEMKVGDLTLVMPIPNGYDLDIRYSDEKAENKEYVAVFSKNGENEFIIGFTDIEYPPSGIDIFEVYRKKYLVLFSTKNAYKYYMNPRIESLDFLPIEIYKPKITLNSQTCVLIQVPVKVEFEKHQLEIMIFQGTLLVGASSLYFSSIVFNGNQHESPILPLTIQNFCNVNNVKSEQ